MRILKALIFLMIIYQPAFGQGLGMLDEEGYDEIPNISIEGNGSKAALPPRIDLEKYCPRVGNQGEIQSCVGWSAGYAALTIERARHNGWTDKYQITNEASSALFPFHYIKRGDCFGGSRIKDIMEFFKKAGNCLANDYDFDPNNCSEKPTPDIVRKAKKYRIDDYFTLFKSKEKNKNKLNVMRLVLSKEKPVVIGMKLKNNFLNLKKSSDEEEFFGGSWWPKIGDTTYAGGHAMVVVGYDDYYYKNRRGNDKMKQGAFKLMNSWGKEWGENGFIWVRYDYFFEHCKYAYAMYYGGAEYIDLDENITASASEEIKEANSNSETIAEETEPKKGKFRNYDGAFIFKKFTGQWNNSTPIFENAPVKFNGKGYELNGEHKVGDHFKLVVETGVQQGYIYVLSVDQAAQTNIHFPKSERTNKKYKGANESAAVLGGILNIPSAKLETMTLEKTGKDQLLVLFSEVKIRTKDLATLAEQLPSFRSDIMGNIGSIIREKFLIPREEITYDYDKMAFEVSTRGKGVIVPILLEVNVQ